MAAWSALSLMEYNGGGAASSSCAGGDVSARGGEVPAGARGAPPAHEGEYAGAPTGEGPEGGPSWTPAWTARTSLDEAAYEAGTSSSLFAASPASASPVTLSPTLRALGDPLWGPPATTIAGGGGDAPFAFAATQNDDPWANAAAAATTTTTTLLRRASVPPMPLSTPIWNESARTPWLAAVPAESALGLPPAPDMAISPAPPQRPELAKKIRDQEDPPTYLFAVKQQQQQHASTVSAPDALLLIPQELQRTGGAAAAPPLAVAAPVHASKPAPAARAKKVPKKAAAQQKPPQPQPDGAKRPKEEGQFEYMPDILPSGMRAKGIGIECDDTGRELPQSIVKVTSTDTGCQMQVTMLAAGFVIGPGGCTVKRIGTLCRCVVQSWSNNKTGVRAVRVFDLSGTPRSVQCASHYIRELVERYKALCEGPFAGQVVPRMQHVNGPCGLLECMYQPPPLSRMPSAARVSSSSSSASGRAGEGGAAPLQATHARRRLARAA